METSPLELTTIFRDFCADLTRLAGSAQQELPPPPQDLRASAIGLVQSRMAELARWPGGLSTDRISELSYAMAAYADECFVELDWSGRGFWRGNLIETQLFGSRAAGQRIFDRIDKLLNGDASAWPALASVYLVMLGLGFRGHFRAASASAEIEHRRAALWSWYDRHQPGSLTGRDRLAPQAYAHTVEEGALVELAAPGRWWAVSALVILLWFGASLLLWSRLSSGINAQIETVTGRVEASGHRLTAEGGVPRR